MHGLRKTIGYLLILSFALCTLYAAPGWAREDGRGRDFTVYFEQDAPVLTAEAQAVVTAAAAYHAEHPESEILVWGHSDRMGSRWHNLRLSKRRARAVGRALVRLNVPGHLITLRWSGETQVPHPTDDGVYQPLNRCAVISIADPASSPVAGETRAPARGGGNLTEEERLR